MQASLPRRPVSPSREEPFFLLVCGTAANIAFLPRILRSSPSRCGVDEFHDALESTSMQLSLVQPSLCGCSLLTLNQDRDTWEGVVVLGSADCAVVTLYMP
jgi:hypothetical protein